MLNVSKAYPKIILTKKRLYLVREAAEPVRSACNISSLLRACFLFRFRDETLGWNNRKGIVHLFQEEREQLRIQIYNSSLHSVHLRGYPALMELTGWRDVELGFSFQASCQLKQKSQTPHSYWFHITEHFNSPGPFGAHGLTHFTLYWFRLL